MTPNFPKIQDGSCHYSGCATTLNAQNSLLRVKWMRRHWLMTPFFTIWKGIAVITMMNRTGFLGD
ncbi:hypothetical protein L085_07745 [Serratia sp. FS14]|nr:hypothetical protein L085_07745 [Serratia sp. FS14]